MHKFIMFSLLGLTSFCLLNLASSQYNIYRQDPFALLSRTLLTYQKAACDGQVLDLVCPSGTKISIQLVQYGRTAPSSQVKKFVAEVCSYPVGINRAQWKNSFIWVASLEEPGFEPLQFLTQGFFSRRSTD